MTRHFPVTVLCLVLVAHAARGQSQDDRRIIDALVASQERTLKVLQELERKLKALEGTSDADRHLLDEVVALQKINKTALSKLEDDLKRMKSQPATKDVSAGLKRDLADIQSKVEALQKPTPPKQPSIMGVWKTTTLCYQGYFIREVTLGSDGYFQRVDYLPGMRDYARPLIGTYTYRDGKLEISVEVSATRKRYREVNFIKWLSDSIIETHTSGVVRVWNKE